MVKRQKQKYVNKIVQKLEFSRTIETTLRIYRNSKTKQIDVDELQNILAGIQRRVGSDVKIMVRAMNDHRLFTFKGFDATELKIKSFEEYYENRVKETEKFEKFKFVEITTLVNKPTVTTLVDKPKVTTLVYKPKVTKNKEIN